MISPARVVLVPLDGTEHAKVALPVAQTWASIEQASLHLLHVAIPDVMHEPSALPERLALRPTETEHAIIHSRTGDPASAIVEVAREYADATIIMCTRTGLETTLGPTGPTAERILAMAPCPIVFVPAVRGLRPWQPRNVLIPHDGSPSTTFAMGRAARLVNSAGARLFVLHVATPGGEHRGETGVLTAPRYVDQAQHEWPAWIEEFLVRLACGCPVDPSAITMNIARGEAANVVLGFVAEHEIDLVVLAWYGGLDERRATVFKRVLREAPCPVLVVRRDEQ